MDQKIASKAVVSAAAISFLFRQFPAFHQHHLRIHLPRAFPVGTEVWMKDCAAMGSSALEMLLSRAGRTRSQGSWNPAESVKDGAAHQSTSVGCKTSKQGDKRDYKRGLKGVFLCALNIFMLLYIHSSIAICIFCSFSVPIQCPKEVIISKIYKCSS